VNIGCVVALEEGMLIPVIRDADIKSVFAIDEELTDLADRAKQRRLLPDAYSGSTFTVSNLGMMGIRTFAAIINPPESAILAVGAIRKELTLKDSKLSEIHVMSLTLSCDHRSVDGITAAKFLVKVKELLEKPDSIIHT
jgi:pyruvate dehydrogenase E2 component (dihydrolipoamide acetyltransferase)